MFQCFVKAIINITKLVSVYFNHFNGTLIFPELEYNYKLFDPTAVER